VLPVPLSDIVSMTAAGEIHPNAMKMARSLQNTGRGSNVYLLPVRPLNLDAFDGRITAYDTYFINPQRLVDDAADSRSDGDWLTMDRTLTPEQRALAGCGNLFGTRCDTARAWGVFPEGGGIDPFNGEGGIFVQSIPLDEPAESTWSTTGTGIQPGTIGTSDESVATRHVPGHPLADADGMVKLPGARGAHAVTVGDTTIDVEFEAGFDPWQDGCFLGETIAGRTVRAVDAGGAPDDELQWFLDNSCNTASKSRWVGAGQTPWVDPPQQMNVAQTLYHPLAGCSALDASIYDPVTGACNFELRDFEQEFLEGNAQIFRSEMAAWAWNLTLFLAVTSCDDQVGDDDITAPDCFNPSLDVRNDAGDPIDIGDATQEQIDAALALGGAWSPGRCSLARPDLCRNVRQLLELTFDDDGDGISDSVDNCLDGYNPVQLDSNGNGSGNACDCDWDGDGRCGDADYDQLIACFGSANVAGTECEFFDMNEDGVVAQPDYSLFLARYEPDPPGDAGSPEEPEASGGSSSTVVVGRCGLGFELALVLPPLMWAHGRKRRRLATTDRPATRAPSDG
jgi:hypothetical protein